MLRFFRLRPIWSVFRNLRNRAKPLRKAHKKGEYFRDLAFDLAKGGAYISRPRRSRPIPLRTALLLWHD
jgi:hypothetical protein